MHGMTTCHLGEMLSASMSRSIVKQCSPPKHDIERVFGKDINGQGVRLFDLFGLDLFECWKGCPGFGRQSQGATPPILLCPSYPHARAPASRSHRLWLTERTTTWCQGTSRATTGSQRVLARCEGPVGPRSGRVWQSALRLGPLS